MGRCFKCLALVAGVVAMPKAVLFDIDGTILDANLSIRETMNRVLLEQRQPTFAKDELERLIGNPLRFILAQKCKDAAVVEMMTHRYRTAYGESGWLLADLFEGIEDLIQDLRRLGVRTGIVTSKGQTESEKLLFDLGVSHHFDAIVGDDDVRPLKPDPAPVTHACHLLGVAPNEAVMVGDTRFDIESAKAAGVQAVGVLWGNGTRASLIEAGADELAGNVAQLRRVLS